MIQSFVVLPAMRLFRWLETQVLKSLFCVSSTASHVNPNVYGIDMPVRGELISSGRSVEEVCEIIGADRLIFQDLGDLIEAVKDTKHSQVDGFDCSVLMVNILQAILMKFI